MSCPETGRTKIVELEHEEKINELVDKKIGYEFDGAAVSEVFNGYIFKITGGFDKDGFRMKNGVLTQARKFLLLKKGSNGFRFRTGLHRDGSKKRKFVRGCIVSADIKVLNLKVMQIGPTPIPGLTDKSSELPKRLAPKRATKILRELGLTDIYNKKKQNPEDRKTVRYLVTKFAGKRTVTTKNGKTYVKRPKVQRLVTPERLRRKRVIKKIKEERRIATEEAKKEYVELLARMKKTNKHHSKK